VVATSFSKKWSKTTQKLGFLHFIDVFHIKGVDIECLCTLVVLCGTFAVITSALSFPGWSGDLWLLCYTVFPCLLCLYSWNFHAQSPFSSVSDTEHKCALLWIIWTDTLPLSTTLGLVSIQSLPHLPIYPVLTWVLCVLNISPTLYHFHWTWFIFIRLVLSLVIPCPPLRLFTCHCKYSSLVLT